MKYKYIALGAGGSSGLGGVNEYLFSTLAKKYELVGVIDTKLSGFWKYQNVPYCFWRVPGISKYLHPVRTLLGEEISNYRMRTKYYVLKRADACERKIQGINDEYDFILQTTWQPALRNKPAKPHFIYEDFTIKSADREYPLWSMFFKGKDKRLWINLETETYLNAAMIFTFSNNTSKSIINDYESKVI